LSNVTSVKMQAGRYSTPKSYTRSARTETRNRAKDELKRVINAVERVRKWERKWVLLKDSSIYIYKWVPVSGPSGTVPKPSVPKPEIAPLRATSTENSNDASNTASNTNIGLNEESNTAFSERGYESDSNQTSERDNSNPCTDFSALVREEKEKKGMK